MKLKQNTHGRNLSKAIQNIVFCKFSALDSTSSSKISRGTWIILELCQILLIIYTHSHSLTLSLTYTKDPAVWVLWSHQTRELLEDIDSEWVNMYIYNNNIECQLWYRQVRQKIEHYDDELWFSTGKTYMHFLIIK